MVISYARGCNIRQGLK